MEILRCRAPDLATRAVNYRLFIKATRICEEGGACSTPLISGEPSILGAALGCYHCVAFILHSCATSSEYRCPFLVITPVCLVAMLPRFMDSLFQRSGAAMKSASAPSLRVFALMGATAAVAFCAGNMILPAGALQNAQPGAPPAQEAKPDTYLLQSPGASVDRNGNDFGLGDGHVSKLK